MPQLRSAGVRGDVMGRWPRATNSGGRQSCKLKLESLAIPGANPQNLGATIYSPGVSVALTPALQLG
uniref:SFRICE_001350 n=1 Tax=Spodoptera frugiperda TaxID=7108 RepID=A0A2H1V8U2_SPOFR